ncbi:hypothetical protein ACS0TY_009822 [Phlomoides rotata]
MPSETTPGYLQQEETVGQEFKDFISHLPKEKGWLASHLYQYQGFWYPVKHLEGVISCQKNFQLQHSDIFLVSAPKSGTTWLKAIIFTLVNRSRFPLVKNHPLITHNPHDLVPFLEIKHYVGDQTPAAFSLLSSPRFFSTHLPHGSLPESLQNSPACKIVYLCRNPKDIFVSLWHFTNRLKPREAQTNSISEVFDMFCRGVSLFGPVWDHALGYWNRSRDNPDGVMFLKYEDMMEKPGIHIRRLAEFLGCPFSGEEEEFGVADAILNMCSFDNLRGLEVNKNGKLSSGEETKAFFRRGVVGDILTL